MTELWNEKNSVISWIDQVEGIFYAQVSELDSLHEKIIKLHLEINKKIMKTKEGAKKEQIIKNCDNLWDTYDKHHERVKFETNNTEKRLANYKEKWFEPKEIIASYEEQMERRFNEYLLEAEVIQDVATELDNMIKYVNREKLEMENYMNLFNDFLAGKSVSHKLKHVKNKIKRETIKNIKKGAKLVAKKVHAAKKAITTTKDNLKAIILPKLALKDMSPNRSYRIRKTDKLLHKSQLLQNEDEIKKLQPKKVKPLHQVIPFRTWAINTEKTPQYNKQSGAFSGVYFT
jgi:hypothetical protein